MREKITAKTVEKHRLDAQKERRGLYLWDTELRGFGCRCSPKGRVSWLVQEWRGGRWAKDGEGKKEGGTAKRVVIGHLPPMSLEKARKEAAQAIGDVAKGVDLVDRKQKERIKLREAINATKLEETITLFVKRNRKPGRYWSELEQIYARDVVSFFGKDSPVASITKADIRQLIEAKQDKHPAAARVLFAALRPLFRWCVERDVIAKSPLEDLKPPAPMESRDRVLSDAELKAFWSATSAPSLFNPFYRLLLLTAQRREEVGSVRWNELDLEAATWTIPKERTKNKKQHVVHLSPQAIAVINELAKAEHEPTDYLFTTTQDTAISGYGKAKARLDELMQETLGSKLPSWRVHDLRRTAASGMAKLGFQPHIVERVINHISGAQGGLVSVYQRYEYVEERKRAIEAWGSYVDQLVSDQPKADNVVPLRA
jgi:integrase